MDNKEIYEALLTIKKCCENTECPHCPLSVGRNPFKCKVADNTSANGEVPSDWKLNGDFDYKAFEK